MEQTSAPAVANASATETTTPNNANQPFRDSRGYGMDSRVSDEPVKGQPGAVSKEQASAPSTEELHEVRINGRLEKLTLTDIKRLASLARANQQKADQQFEQLKKHSEWKEKAKHDAMSALMDPELGLSKDQIREKFEKWYHQEFILPETMTEDQRRAHEYEKRLKAYEEKEEYEKQTQAQRAQAEYEANVAQTLQSDMIKALEENDLPKSKFVVQRMAFWMKRNLAQGFDAPMEVIVQNVKNDLTEHNRDWLKNASPQQIIATLGEDIISKLRKHDVEQLKKRFQPASPIDQMPGVTRRQKRTTMGDVDNYFNELRRTK